MNKNIISIPDLKEIEMELFRQLQQVFSETMGKILTDLDTALMEARDKKRYRHVDKRGAQVDTLFGPVTFKRNYYKDRQSGKYVHLLDKELKFNGAGGASPLVEDLGVELSIEGPSFRSAANTLEKLLGYRVVSHEWIRQKLHEIELPTKSELIENRLLFVEVDGVHISRQNGKRKRKEEKIATVHQGWKVNGKRVSLINKRHFHHDSDEPFWEAFESFLYETYGYDPTVHLLVVNGDEADWIQNFAEESGKNTYVLADRYHVIKSVRQLFREHPRKRNIQRAVIHNDIDRLLIELNSAVGTMPTEDSEKELENMIKRIEKNPDAYKDFKKWLEEKGIDTDGIRGMGNAESTMRVFARRLKNGRSWSDYGLKQMIRGMICKLDRIPIQINHGFFEAMPEEENEFIQVKDRAKNAQARKWVQESIRDNVPYLTQAIGKPVYQAIKGLRGI